MVARFLVAALIAGFWSVVFAAGVPVSLPKAPIDSHDIESLQRGAAIFIGYCLGCHEAAHMRYGRLAEDISITPDDIKEKIIFTDAGLGSGMKNALSFEKTKNWFNEAPPPDLSLIARLRSVDWLYAYMRGFYRDPTRPSGWNNKVFNNVAMPNVMANLQGVAVLDESGEIELVRPGRLSVAQYDLLIADLVNFLDYMGEPGRSDRHRIGFLVMAVLLVLLVLSYFLYRDYWRDIE